MKKKTIWVHTLVKNEERYLWFAVMSVIDYVDKILLWDTGSSDKTVEIIKKLQEVKGSKISFQKWNEVTPEEFTKVRQKMLEETTSDWFIVLDGDEVWWEDSIKKIIDTINKEGDSLETVVSPYYNVVGDIYHYQEGKAGMYQIDDKVGHYNIRAINRKIPGLHLEKPHGQQGFYDDNGVLIQNRDPKKRQFIDAPYMHFTNMMRSSKNLDKLVPKRSSKYKYEIGIPFPKDLKYPEVFYQSYPDFISSPWQKISKRYLARSLFETALRKIKRRLFPNKQIGY